MSEELQRWTPSVYMRFSMDLDRDVPEAEMVPLDACSSQPGYYAQCDVVKLEDGLLVQLSTLRAELERVTRERDLLRELVKAKDEYIACYKLNKRPTEKLFNKLAKLAAALAEKGEGEDANQ